MRSSSCLGLVILVILFQLKLYQFGSDYKIYPNSLEHKRGYLNFIQEDEKFIYVGARKYLYRISKSLIDPIQVILSWSGNFTAEKCYRSDEFFIKYLSASPSPVTTSSSDVREICATDGCQHLCQQYDFQKNRFISLSSGRYMVPVEETSSPVYLSHNNDLWVALSTQQDASMVNIAKHINRTLRKSAGEVIVSSQNNFNSLGLVEFKGMLNYQHKTYFILNEDTSEFTNYQAVFSKIRVKQITTRIGRICDNDKGVRPPIRLFSSFVRASLSCNINNSWSENQYKADSIYQYSHHPDIVAVMFTTNRKFQSLQNSQTFVCFYNMTHIDQQFSESNIAILHKSDSYWIKKRADPNLVSCIENAAVSLLNKEWLLTQSIKPLLSQKYPYNFLINLTNGQVGQVTAFTILENIHKTILLPKSHCKNIQTASTINNSSHTNKISLDMDILFVGTDRGFIGRGIILTDKSLGKLRASIERSFWEIYNIGVKSVNYYHHRTVRIDNYLPLQTIERPIVRQLRVVNNLVILALGDSFVERLPVGFCAKDCRTCNRNFDPLCQWNINSGICEIIQLKTHFSNSNSKPLIIRTCLNELLRKNPAESSIPYQRPRYDTFWLIFCLVLFVTIFIIVLTVSLVARFQCHSQYCYDTNNNTRDHRFNQSNSHTHNNQFRAKPKPISYKPIQTTQISSDINKVDSSFHSNNNCYEFVQHKPCTKPSNITKLKIFFSTNHKTLSRTSSFDNPDSIEIKPIKQVNKPSLVLENKINIKQSLKTKPDQRLYLQIAQQPTTNHYNFQAPLTSYPNQCSHCNFRDFTAKSKWKSCEAALDSLAQNCDTFFANPSNL